MEPIFKPSLSYKQTDLFGKELIVSFLERHPWSDMHFLKTIMKYPDSLLKDNKEFIKYLYLDKQIGICFANKEETYCLVPGIWRFRLARAASLILFGADPVYKGRSPGIQADLELWFSNTFYRIWVDMGGLAPESLHFITNPPDNFQPNITDIVVTLDQKRIELLSTQIQLHFKHNNVSILLFGGKEFHKVYISNKNGPRSIFTGYSEEEISRYLDNRRAQSTRADNLGKIASQLSDNNWSTLIMVGNNPTFTMEELAFIFSKADTKEIQDIFVSLKKLFDKKLLTYTNKTDHRVIVSPYGLDLLSRYWGVSLEYLAKYNPWPMKNKQKGGWSYSTGWANNIPEHTNITRLFVISLIDNARRLSNSSGGCFVELVTIIGNRMIYKDKEGKLKHVIPDAVLNLSIWSENEVQGLPNKVLIKTRAIVEIDRSTERIVLLEDKIARLADAYLAQKEKPVLLWIVDDSADIGREYCVIKELQKYPQINAWTTTTSRLILSRDHDWFIYNPTIGYEIDFSSYGGMSPLRPIWFNNQDLSLKYKNLFNLSPWINGVKMKKSEFLISDLNIRRPGFM